MNPHALNLHRKTKTQEASMAADVERQKAKRRQGAESTRLAPFLGTNDAGANQLLGRNT